LYPSDILGIIGPNGAGKSTLLYILLGIVSPTIGDIYYFGEKFFKNRSKIFYKIGFASQYISLSYSLTVEENLKVAEILAWALVLLFLPFSAVFYPVEVLPESFQTVAKLVPTSYIFETFRQILLEGYTPYVFILKAYALVFVYFSLSVGIFILAFNFAKKQEKLLK